jgi:hypothetical protein
MGSTTGCKLIREYYEELVTNLKRKKIKLTQKDIENMSDLTSFKIQLQ